MKPEQMLTPEMISEYTNFVDNKEKATDFWAIMSVEKDLMIFVAEYLDRTQDDLVKRLNVPAREMSTLRSKLYALFVMGFFFGNRRWSGHIDEWLNNAEKELGGEDVII